MASAVAHSKNSIRSLLLSRSPRDINLIQSSTKRSYRVLAAKNTPHAGFYFSGINGDVDGGIASTFTLNDVAFRRFFSKYVSVDHSAAYEAAMKSNHGIQLQLALEEGKGKDDLPFDPFSQFLDQMGTTDDDEDEDEGIEEAEFVEKDSSEGEIIGEGGDQDADADQDDGDEDDDDDFEEEDEDGDIPSLYAADGSVIRPRSERLSLRAGYPAGGSFAVIHLAGFQHKVTKDDLLVVNKLKPVDHWSVGSTHTLKDDDILLMGNPNTTLVGIPGVKGAEVDLMVEEITRDKTVIVFKKRRRKNSRRKKGFRRQVTFLRVLDVRMPEENTQAEVEDETIAA